MANRKRIDPVSRPPDGSRPWDRIQGKDPSRHYVLVHPTNEDCGLPYYESLGYRVETASVDGPRSAMARTQRDGTEIRSGGLVLVSCPIEEHEARWQAGQRQADAIDRRTLKDANIDDPMRGRGYDYRVDVADGKPELVREGSDGA